MFWLSKVTVINTIKADEIDDGTVFGCLVVRVANNDYTGTLGYRIK
jgi:hypothetical protein